MDDIKGRVRPLYRPLLILGTVFASGIAAASNFGLPAWLILYLLILAAGISFFFLNKKRSFVLAVIIIFFLSGFIRLQAAAVIGKDDISRYAGPDKDVIVSGFIADYPLDKTGKFNNSWVEFVFKPDYLIKENESHKVSGNILIRLYGRQASDFHYGESYLLEGRLLKPRQSLKSDFNYPRYLARRYIFSILNVKKHNGVVDLKKQRGSRLKAYTGRLQRNLSRRYREILPEPHASILEALMLGRRQGIPDEVWSDLRKTGTVHILAISGLHIGLLALIFIFIFKLLRFNLKAASLACIALLVFYAVLTGQRPSVVRAVIMASVLLAGRVIGHDADTYNSLGLAALVILLINPYELFAVGFQLSFVCVLGILYLAPRLMYLGEKIGNQRINLHTNPLLNYTFKAFSASLAACIASAPLTLYYFQMAAPVGVLLNIIVVPLIGIAVALGLSISILLYPLSQIARILANTLVLDLTLILKAAAFFKDAPFSYIRLDSFSLSSVIIYYAGAVCIFNAPALYRCLLKRPGFKSKSFIDN